MYDNLIDFNPKYWGGPKSAAIFPNVTTFQAFQMLSITHKFLVLQRAVGSVNFIASDFNHWY